MDALSDAQLFAWIEHLELCPSCRARLGGRSPVDTMYQDVFDRALIRALAASPCIEESRNSAPGHLTELLQLSSIDRAAAIAREARFKTYSLATHTLERCEAAIPHNPQFALDLARLAYSISLHIDPRACGGTEALMDLRAFALAREGNALRVCGDLATALAAFSYARRTQKRGGIDLDLASQIDLMESSLRRDLRHANDALTLLDRAAEISLLLDDHELWLKIQINRANAFIVQEEFDSACNLLNEILPKADTPKLAAMIRHSLATALASAGRFHEASRLLEEAREPYLQASNPLATSRLLWVEGTIAKGLGHQERADRLLREAGTDLAERGYALDAAQIGLDLRKLQADRRFEPVC